MLDDFRSTDSVRLAVNNMKLLSRLEAEKIAKGMCKDCDDVAIKTITFDMTGKKYRTETEVAFSKWDLSLYSIGGSTFFRSGKCSLSVDCKNRTFTYSCNFNFSINDSFTQPLTPIGIDSEVIGGTPYPITASWNEKHSGSGAF
jgi:hypothetical protein